MSVPQEIKDEQKKVDDAISVNGLLSDVYKGLAIVLREAAKMLIAARFQEEDRQ